MKNYIAIYSRHYKIGYELCETYQDAFYFLECGSDMGALFPLCIYDLETDELTEVGHLRVQDMSSVFEEVINSLNKEQ